MLSYSSPRLVLSTRREATTDYGEGKIESVRTKLQLTLMLAAWGNSISRVSAFDIKWDQKLIGKENISLNLSLKLANSRRGEALRSFYYLKQPSVGTFLISDDSLMKRNALATTWRPVTSLRRTTTFLDFLSQALAIMSTQLHKRARLGSATMYATMACPYAHRAMFALELR